MNGFFSKDITMDIAWTLQPEFRACSLAPLRLVVKDPTQKRENLTSQIN